MSASDGELEVIEVKAAESLVPNLTISVENAGEEPVVEFIDEDEKMTTDNAEQKSSSVEIKLEDKSFSHTKIYENKMLKDIGLTAEEARLRKQNRAKRFQSPLLRDEKDDEDPDKKEVNELIQKVKDYNKDNDIFKEIRLDAVHLRGLDDMSTDDIFGYFRDHFPSHIEWINDTSCNVVWKDQTSAAHAIIAMSVPISEGKTDTDKGLDKKEASLTEKESEDELDLMNSDDENEDKMDVSESTQAKGSTQPFTNEIRQCKHPFKKSNKKTVLEMRFANINDKKSVGGANRSQYYRKYGNPNYGNTKGILSRSFKKRYHGRIAKREYEDYRPEESVPEKKVTKRLYSEQAWVEAKRLKKNEDSESSSEDEKDRTEREDLELINSSAKDLNDSIPINKSNKMRYKTLEADEESERNDAEKSLSRDAHFDGILNVKVRNAGSVFDRLGRRSGGRQSTPLEQDKVGSTLSKSLKDRLGAKHS